MKGSDHQLTKEQACLLQGISVLPREFRIESFQKLFGDLTNKQLFELLADIIGLANGVVESTREYIEEFLVVEHGYLPHKAEQVNLPTLFGALNGVKIAIEPVPGMCRGCAFRAGTPANHSPVTAIDASCCVSDGSEFLCHMKPIGGTPGYETGTRCAGYAARRGSLLQEFMD